MKFIVPIIILLLASPLYAQSWTLSCNPDIANRKSIKVGQVLCFDPAANTDDSPIIDVSGSGYTSWSYFADKNGDETVCTVSFTIQKCPAGDLSTTEADNGCVDVNVTDATLSSTNTGVGGVVVGSPYMRVQAGGAGDNAEDCRIMVMGGNQ